MSFSGVENIREIFNVPPPNGSLIICSNGVLQKSAFTYGGRCPDLTSHFLLQSIWYCSSFALSTLVVLLYSLKVNSWTINCYKHSFGTSCFFFFGVSFQLSAKMHVLILLYYKKLFLFSMHTSNRLQFFYFVAWSYLTNGYGFWWTTANMLSKFDC